MTWHSSIPDSELFSEISGDYNPIHLDKLFSASTPFGKPILYGMSIFFECIELAINDIGPKYLELSHARLIFLKPAFVGEEINFTFEKKGELGFVFYVYCNRRKTKLAICDFGFREVDFIFWSLTDKKIPGEFESLDLLSKDIESFQCESNKIGIGLNRTLLSKYTPLLCRYFSAHHASMLLAVTRLIGMKIPGIGGVFNELRLTTNSSDIDFCAHYKVKKINKIISQIQLVTESNSIQTLSKVTYMNLTKRTRVERCSLFSKQKALIIGGTGSLGRVLVEMLSMTGASVTYTYRTHDLNFSHLSPEANQSILGVKINNPDDILELSKSHSFTHFYFFSSPNIFDRKPDTFDIDKFNEFSRVYIDLLDDYLRVFDSGVYFIPSTVAIDDYIPGLATYAAAKSAMETWCRHYEGYNNKVKFLIKRIPSMISRQTSNNILKSELPFDYLADIIEEMENING